MKYTFRVSIQTGLIFIGLLLVLTSTIVCAEVPSTINYQGYLTDNAGEPLQGDQLIVFSIYDDGTAGTLVWSEQQTVTVQDGVFNVRLGAVVPFAVIDFDIAQLYLEMQIFASGSGWEPLSPRQPLTSTAFAMHAGDADTLEGQGAAAFAPAVHEHDAVYVNTGEANSITSAMVADNAIGSSDLAADSVGAGQISTGAVGSSEVADNSLTATDLAEGSVRTSEIADGGITRADFAKGAVMEAVLDEDGSSSGLDADLLDGHSSSFFATSTHTHDSRYVDITGDTMTGDLNIDADLNVSGSSTTTTDYAATFTSSGGAYASAIKGVANSSNYSARGLHLDVDSLNSYATGAIIDVDAPESSATGIDVDVSGRSSNTIGLDAYAISTEGIAQGLRTTARAESGSSSGAFGINANAVHYGTGYLHGIDIDASHYGTAGEATGIDISLYGSDAGDAKGVYAISRKSAGSTGGVAYGGHFIGDNDRRYVPGDESYGVLGEATGLDGSRYGVYGRATTTGDTENNYAVYAQAATSDYYAYGYYADVDISTAAAIAGYGAFYDVDADTASDGTVSGLGVEVSHSGSSGTAYGVRAWVYASDTGNAYGVYSYVPSGYTTGNAYAGYFSGNVHVTGTLSKGGGSFKIDHPLDPENRYLQHSFVESPDMMNVYNGNVVLDGKGEAWVEMPEYFEALNRDFRYQLTCIGGFAQVYIAEEIIDNRFKIAGGMPMLKVSWQVTGIRRDAWAEANRIQVEVDKDATEKGSYLAPEAFGLDPTRGVEFAHDPEMIREYLEKGNTEPINSKMGKEPK